MKIPKPNRISERRKAAGLTQQELADRLGVHWMTISKLERGRMQLTIEWAERLAKALDLKAHDMVDWEPAKRDLLISGVIKDGHIVVREEEPEFQTFEDDETFHTATQWFYCHGDHLRPFFFDGDVLGFRSVFEEDFKHLIGRLAVVTFYLDKESHSDVLVVVSKHLRAMQFNLRTLQGLHINNVEVHDIAVFRAALVRAPEVGEEPDPDTELILPKSA